jgi:RHS repeat-associated protein
VNSSTFDAAGRVFETTDPMGRINRMTYDDLGRTVKTVENYVDGTVSDADDKTVEYVFGPAGLVTLRVKLTGGGVQETGYVYGVSTTTGDGLTSNDIVKETRHPDASTGAPSSTQADAVKVNRLGQTVETTDRNGTVHQFTFDPVGRLIADIVPTVGSGINADTLAVETTYDGAGNPYLLTTYNNVSYGPGSVLTQIRREYNGLGQLVKEYQEVNGAVNSSTTPKVQYAYSFTNTGTMNHSRPTTLTYPNGRVLTHNYASGINNDVSRLSSITDGSITLESYDYLGSSTVVRRGHAQPGVDLTSIKLSGEPNGDAGDQYTGLDRFGRIVDQRWTAGTTAKDRTQYGYDRNSNRLWRENVVASTRSELYTYDGFNQLASFARGTLNGTKTAITGTPLRSQSWDFDSIGNFDSQTTDGVAQTRGHNKQNEITSVNSATTPTYDANGNLTTSEAGTTYEYDAWNRMKQSQDTKGDQFRYRWDAIGRRVEKYDRVNDVRTNLYYSDSWQVLEERIGSAASASYAWSPVYDDAMIARNTSHKGPGFPLNTRLYAIHDANFNIVGLLNTSGTVVERYAYDPFGTFEVLNASWGTISGSGYAWNYLHQGGRYDATAGLYSFRHREYSPTLGRWTTMDPIGFEGGDYNVYRYIYNNCINYADPSGLWGTWVTIGTSKNQFGFIDYQQMRGNRVDYVAGTGRWSNPGWAGSGGATYIKADESTYQYGGINGWVTIESGNGNLLERNLFNEDGGVCNTITANPITQDDDSINSGSIRAVMSRFFKKNVKYIITVEWKIKITSRGSVGGSASVKGNDGAGRMVTWKGKKGNEIVVRSAKDNTVIASGSFNVALTFKNPGNDEIARISTSISGQKGWATSELELGISEIQ